MSGFLGALEAALSATVGVVELVLVELVELGVDELGPVEFRLIELDDTQSILSPSSVCVRRKRTVWSF